MENRTTLVYLEREGCYLMMHRTKKKNDENGGKWIGIGGHFEEGESAEECMKREVLEECGVTPTAYRERGKVTFISDEWGPDYMYLFTVSAWQGDFDLDCDEGELAFVEREKVLSLPMWEGDKIFLALIAADAAYFNLTLEYKGETLSRAELNGKELAL